jgi:hypothetical protein
MNYPSIQLSSQSTEISIPIYSKSFFSALLAVAKATQFVDLLNIKTFEHRIMNTVDKNTYRAYINPANIPADDDSDIPMHQRPINAINLAWKVTIPESLEAASIRVLAENWTTYPDIYAKFQQCEDQRTFLDILSIDLPLSDLCAHIDEDAFWKRMVRHRWFFYSPMGVKGKKWIQIFLEKHLAEQLENMKPADYEVEVAQQLAELCAKNVETLMVRYLQPAAIGTVDHIPLDVFLTNLPELRKIDLTYDVKNVDTNFTLGATNLSENDIKNLAKGLECCMELKEFRVHSTKLEPPMLKMIANALDKACRNLEAIAFPHCRFGDNGLESFLLATTKDSFLKLKEVVLTNNFICK